MQILSKDIFTTTIHGTTGQEIDEGTLVSGCKIKNVREHEETPFGKLYRFEVSTDDGKTWFTQQSFELPETETTFWRGEIYKGDKLTDMDFPRRQTKEEAFADAEERAEGSEVPFAAEWCDNGETNTGETYGGEPRSES